MAIETCINCKETIGQLEQAYIYKNNIVCRKCYQRLTEKASQSNQNYTQIAKSIDKPITETQITKQDDNSSDISLGQIFSIIIIIGFIVWTIVIAETNPTQVKFNIAILLISAGLAIKPIRKSIGLLFVIIGILVCLAGIIAPLTEIGLLIGLPLGAGGLVVGIILIFLGGIFLFS